MAFPPHLAWIPYEKVYGPIPDTYGGSACRLCDCWVWENERSHGIEDCIRSIADRLVLAAKRERGEP